MKKAILILGDGTAIPLEGRFFVITETADGTPGIVEHYKDGRECRAGIICDTLHDALDQIREDVARWRRRSR